MALVLECEVLGQHLTTTPTRARAPQRREEERGERRRGESTTQPSHDTTHYTRIRERKYNPTALSYYTTPNQTMRPRKAASLRRMGDGSGADD